MTKQPLVSIITPMYNAENYIEETINSVIAQSHTNWEMLIVDNYSTDTSREIVKRLEHPNIKLIELPENSGGPAHPRNIGIHHAKGKYIAFLDADDLWSEDKLKEQIHFMLVNDLDLSSTDKSDFNEHGIIKERFLVKIKKYLIKDNISIKSLFIFNSIYTSSVMVKREETPITFDTQKELMAVEDLYLWLTLLEKGYKYQYLPNRTLQYRIVETSASNHSDKRIVKLRHLFALNKFILANKRYDLYSTYLSRACLRAFL